jgi:hypothetical protein
VTDFLLKSLLDFLLNVGVSCNSLSNFILFEFPTTVLHKCTGTANSKLITSWIHNISDRPYIDRFNCIQQPWLYYVNTTSWLWFKTTMAKRPRSKRCQRRSKRCGQSGVLRSVKPWCLLIKLLVRFRCFLILIHLHSFNTIDHEQSKEDTKGTNMLYVMLLLCYQSAMGRDHPVEFYLSGWKSPLYVGWKWEYH